MDLSEFKFACPVCGQHITAHAEAAGSRLQCPTCFRSIVVPQPPASAGPKLLLSASEAAKPRPAPAGAGAAAPLPSKRKSNLAGWLLFLLLAGAAAGALFDFRTRIFKIFGPGRAASDTNAATAAEHRPAPVWTLDLTNAVIPQAPAFGSVRGHDFTCHQALLQGGTLSLRGGPTEEVTIYFFAHRAADFSGRSFEVKTNDARAPRVTLRWRENARAYSETFKGGYALKVDFERVRARKISGRIYLCLPDNTKSVVAGHFAAEIRRRRN